MAEISFNPSLTLNGQNTFRVQTQGLFQGAYMDDPVARMWLLAGLVDSTVTQPMWGGMAITENVNTNASNTYQYATNNLTIAANNGAITGFTTFNQAHNMIIVPGNRVPIAVANQNIAFFRLGSNIRLPVKISSALLTALEGNPVNQQVSWDFTNHQLTTYSSGAGALPVKVLRVAPNSFAVSYDSGTGVVSWTSAACALIQI